MSQLNQEMVKHWKQLRHMTYDLVNILSQEDVSKRLPFKKSQSLGNQFYCMTGTQETFASYYIESGKWNGWSCSLEDGDNPKLENIKTSMEKADKILFKVLENRNLMEVKGNGTLLSRYLRLVEHESHHQGQLINFMYALDLEIPKSFTDKWGLEE